MDLTSFLNPKMLQKIPLLPPEALKYLLKQIEDMPDGEPNKEKMFRIADIATKTLNQKQEETAKAEKRQYNMKRYFYLPFNKILFDGELDTRQSGRISRHSMEKIWEYIEKKLMPNEVEELGLAFKTAIIAKEMKKAKIIVNEFNRLAGQKLEETIVKCREDKREWARFAMVIGNKLVAKDAEELCFYLQNIGEIERAIKLFSVEITELSGANLTKITNEIIRIKENNPKLLPIYIALLIDSLKHPAHILRVIQKFYRIDDASSAAKCDLSILGNILLFNARIGAHNLSSSKNSRKTREDYLQYYMSYAEIILGLEREFDVSPISSWGKEIIELRGIASGAIDQDILACPRQLKNIMGRYQKVVDGGEIVAPTEQEIGDLNSCIYLLQGIKNYISATSCNAIFRESFAKCVRFIEVFSVGIVDQLRRKNSSHKNQLLPYLEISRDLLRIIKDDEQAEIYHKGGLLAMRDDD